MSQPKLNPRAAPFHPKNIPPPPPPPYPFFLHAQYYFYRRETRVFRTFSKLRRSPPNPVTKPSGWFVPPRQRTPTYRKTLFSQWKPKNTFSGNPNPRRNGGGGDRTSVMIKNIPSQFRRNMLIELLDKLSEENHLEYDFLYLPMDFVRGNSLGYAFVNFTTAGAATKIRELLRGYKWSCCNQTDGANKSFSGSKKICAVNYARLQGKKALVHNFENSFFRCNNEEWLPVVFAPPRNGSNVTTTEQITIGKCRVKIN